MKFIWFCIILLTYGCVSASRDDYDFPEGKNIDIAKQLEVSLEVVSEQIKANSNNASLYIKRAKIYVQQENYEEALKDINVAERLSPNSGEILYQKSYLMDKLGQEKALDNALFAEDQGFDNPALYSLISKLYLDKKDYQKADIYLVRAENIYPYYPEIFNIKGRSFAIKQDTSSAIYNYKKAIELKPTEFKFYDDLIKIYSQKKLVDSALIYNERAIKRFPENAELLFNKGLILENYGFADSSIAIYQQFLKLEPERGDVYEKIGDLYMKFRNFDAAQRNYSKWVEVNPENITAKLKSARVFLAQGNLAAAKYSLTKSLEKHPNNGELKAELYALESRIDYYQRAAAAQRANEAALNAEEEERIFDRSFKIEQIQKRVIGRDSTRN